MRYANHPETGEQERALSARGSRLEHRGNLRNVVTFRLLDDSFTIQPLAD